MQNSVFANVIGITLVYFLMFFIVNAAADHRKSNCLPKFTSIGKKCYYFSKVKSTWNEAHFTCSNLNSSLAIITRPRQTTALNRYLSRHHEGIGGKFERWIGGRYNEKMSKWIWGENGKSLIFHGFSGINTESNNWAWHCIAVDPAYENKWRARSCLEKKFYICQHPRNAIKRNINNECGAGTECPLTENISPGYLVKGPVKKRKIYQLATFVCPSHMILVGRSCYFFSVTRASWSNAYWACRDNRTKLAVITTKVQDNILRGFLQGNFTEKQERWIGGIYDWKQERWKWAMSGRLIKYTNFANPDLIAKSTNIHSCITLDPEFNHKWNSKSRFIEKHYICQAASKSVMKYVKTIKTKSSVVMEILKKNRNAARML